MSVVVGSLLLALAPLLIAAARHSPRLMVVVALGTVPIPFVIPNSYPLERSVMSLFVFLFIAKALQFAAGHERPRGFANVLHYIVTPAVVRWNERAVPDSRQALRSLSVGLLHLAFAAILVAVVVRADLRNPVELLTTQLGIYASLAGVTALITVPLSLRGLRYRAPFDRPFAARTPAEFWGRRWNTWVNALLHRYVFLPTCGRRHVTRGTLAAFAASGVLHEAIVFIGTLSFTGWPLAFFLFQGVLVVVTSRSAWFRRLYRRFPAITRAVTLFLLLLSGVMLVRGLDGVDPSRAWRRCCYSLAV